ncbi:GNAT family N-acetyltransferase [Exiguobacterium aurantiacum]|uniref:Predicted acetyltransferase n=1 Tax=Exiguobacterium aurantiacum TaxID=33987 RepID=A0A377FVI2_9BACL|nr:GNAT family N-acetyltransferase [Exiguobacterium aurantiacum]STO08809.1 Predicted acetyltransferase [Exiguobacterium aurantiacum]
MEFKVWTNPDAFAERVLPELMKREAEHSLMIGILGNIQRGVYPTYHQLTVEDDGQLLAIMQVTPPHPLNYIIVDASHARDVHLTAIPALLERDIPFTEIVSERVHAESFAALWREHTGRNVSPFMAQGLYRLERVNEIKMAEGTMRHATTDDQALLEDWYRAFERDSGLDPSETEKVVRTVTMMIENDDAVIWEVDGTPVSCAKRSRPTENGVTVSFVYTVPERRGNGYARSIVAELSRELLKTKRFCTLYTDLTNPTSNKIYQEVGYEPIMESSWIRLAR